MFEKSWQINTHGTRTRVRPSCLEAVKYDRIWTFQTPSDSRQILSSMCLLQLPESCHEACTPSVNLALAGLFKHPLNAVTVDDKLAALILVAVGTLAIIYVVGELRW